MDNIMASVRHGLIMAVASLLLGAVWAAYLATHHEALHAGFGLQETGQKAAMRDMDMGAMRLEMGLSEHHSHEIDMVSQREHVHGGSLATDAMQRLLRGHIHFMGLGVLAAVLLLITAFTQLKPVWKKVLGWSFGLGALAYPPAWILMGFRTVELGPKAAEASVMWLFGPAVALLLASLLAVLAVLVAEASGLQHRLPLVRPFFVQPETAAGMPFASNQP